MRKISATNKVKTSTGEYVSASKAAGLIVRACREAMEEQYAEYGYNFCVICGVNNSYSIIDPSHDESVKSCKENGRAEKAWDKGNIKPRCRDCHNKHDKLNIQNTKL